jgi:hypothetical protein
MTMEITTVDDVGNEEDKEITVGEVETEPVGL